MRTTKSKPRMAESELGCFIKVGRVYAHVFTATDTSVQPFRGKRESKLQLLFHKPDPLAGRSSPVTSRQWVGVCECGPARPPLPRNGSGFV
jgi:hypothetical protein